jgi:hypothetical protein
MVTIADVYLANIISPPIPEAAIASFFVQTPPAKRPAKL